MDSGNGFVREHVWSIVDELMLLMPKLETTGAVEDAVHGGIGQLWHSLLLILDSVFIVFVIQRDAVAERVFMGSISSVASSCGEMGC